MLRGRALEGHDLCAFKVHGGGKAYGNQAAREGRRTCKFAPLPGPGRTYVPSVPTKAKETFSKSPRTEARGFLSCPSGGAVTVSPEQGLSGAGPRPVTKPLLVHSCSLLGQFELSVW